MCVYFYYSSAPEEAEHFTLHIRGAGNWTKKLYDYYEAFSTAEVVYRRKSTVRKLRSQSEIRRSASSRPRIQKTISGVLQPSDHSRNSFERYAICLLIKSLEK